MIALAGRPNVGKSTFVNLVVGEKIAIVSDKPQTTRREMRGVLTRDDFQLVLIDLPGSQRPRDAMTKRMQGRVLQALSDCDGALFLLNGEQKIGIGDNFISDLLKESGVPVVTALNKTDRLSRAQTLKALQIAAELAPGELYPVSARTGEGVDELLEALCALLPEGPFLFEPGSATDQPESVRLSEMVREQVLLRTRDEIPHAVEVDIEEIELQHRDDGDFTIIHASIWVETKSQKRILIGSGGKMVKAVGTAARPAIEKLTGTPVHLDLKVVVRRDWRRDDNMLDKLGIG